MLRVTSQIEFGRENLRKWSVTTRLSKSLPNLAELPQEKLDSDAPFSLKWIYGYNHHAPIINLNRNYQTIIFYAASNYGIIYDWKLNTMRFLRGHRNAVLFLDKDVDARWLMTADSGEDNTIIIWQCKDLHHARTIFNPHGKLPLAKVAFSSKYLLTLAYPDADKAIIYWWIWSFGSDAPNATIELETPKDSITHLFFNPVRAEQFFITSADSVWVGTSREVEKGDFGRTTIIYDLVITNVLIRSDLEFGHLTWATYSPVSSQLLITTSIGYCLVFGPLTTYEVNPLGIEIVNYRFVKALHLDKHHKLTFIASIEDLIVTGNTKGEIKFYDPILRIVYWYQDFHLKSIIGISFDLMAKDCRPKVCSCKPRCECHKKLVDKLKLMAPKDATIDENLFVLRQFIVWSRHEGIGLVDVWYSKYTPLVAHTGFTASGITARCNRTQVAMGYRDGLVELWNFTTHRLIAKRDLRKHFTKTYPPDDVFCTVIKPDFVPELAVSALTFSTSEIHLACGLEDGKLIIMHPLTLEVGQIFRESKKAIKLITFSPDSIYLALYDHDYAVQVYFYCCANYHETGDPPQWEFVGKYRAHYKEITALFFIAEKDENDIHRLFSVSEENLITEYDIGRTVDFCLKLKKLESIDLLEIPLNAIEWPTPEECACGPGLPTILYATSGFKYKILNYKTMEVLGTFLGPLLDFPVNMMLMTKHLRTPTHTHVYIVFAAHNMIGIQKAPLDGNPFKNVYMLGHPKKITHMCYCDKHRTLFTSEKRESIVFEWLTNFHSVDLSTKKGGPRLHPYFKLFEGGADGKEFQEVKDMFYYIQIVCQGTFTPELRRVGDDIPVDALPDIMRGLGFFPTQYEVGNIMREAAYRILNTSPAETIEFEDFVKLYVNHRPAYGYDYKMLEKSFQMFVKKRQTYYINRKDLMDTFTQEGEAFTPELAHYLLKNVVENNDMIYDKEVTLEDQFKEHIPDRTTFPRLLDVLKMKKEE